VAKTTLARFYELRMVTTVTDFVVAGLGSDGDRARAAPRSSRNEG
jgi:hypothetical protein